MRSRDVPGQVDFERVVCGSDRFPEPVFYRPIAGEKPNVSAPGYNQVRPHSSLGYLIPEEFRMGHADVETATRLPHLHSPDCGENSLLLNSTASTLT